MCKSMKCSRQTLHKHTPHLSSQKFYQWCLWKTHKSILTSPIWSLQSTLSSEWLFPQLSHQHEGVTSLAWPTDNNKIFNISSLPRCKSLVLVTSLTSSLFSFPFAFIPLCPWQPIYRSVGRWMSNTATCQSGFSPSTLLPYWLWENGLCWLALASLGNWAESIYMWDCFHCHY